MKIFRLVLCALALPAVGTGAAPAQAACMQADVPDGWTSGGLLRKRMFKDGRGRPEAAYILTMPQAECLRGSDPSDNVGPTTTVQVYSFNRTVERRIARFVGKRVMVTGRAFGALTVHHHAPIVVDVSAIDLP